jgi:hypothetical protein
MADTPTVPQEEVGLDLDAGRPSTFRLRGEVYAVRRVSPIAYAAALRTLDETEKAADATLEDIWGAQLDFIEVGLEESSSNGHMGLDRFRELRALEHGGIEVRDIRPLMRYLMEVYTGRPTQSGEDSSTGPGSSAPSSKAAPGSLGVVRPS